LTIFTSPSNSTSSAASSNAAAAQVDFPEYPQGHLAALARLVEAGKPRSGSGQQLC
jgi:hypothetical protein